MIKSRTMVRNTVGRAKQRGVVLFFALVALVVMSLAAVALIRSVDTSTMIAGNLAFRQSATISGDAGIEAANNWLTAQQQAMKGRNIFMDPTHTFNVDNAAMGYYTSIPANNPKWFPLAQDKSGNTVSYIIERLCRTANALPRTANCLFSPPDPNGGGNSAGVYLPTEICQGAGCPPTLIESPQYRITVQITGPRNTVNSLQAFVY